MAKKRFKGKNPYRKIQRRDYSKNRKFGVAKSLGYSGFHCFKESAYGTMKVVSGGQGQNFAPSLQQLTINGNIMPNASWVFNINQVSDYRNYQNLFQQYRITGVKIKIFPSHAVSNTDVVDTASQAVSLSSRVPSLVYKFDPNDITNPSSWQGLLEKDPKFIPMNRPRSIYIKPKLQLVSQSGIQADTTVQTNSVKWLQFGASPASVANDNYVGLDMGVHNINGDTDFDFIMTYYFQCKTPT